MSVTNIHCGYPPVAAVACTAYVNNPNGSGGRVRSRTQSYNPEPGGPIACIEPGLAVAAKHVATLNLLDQQYTLYCSFGSGTRVCSRIDFQRVVA